MKALWPLALGLAVAPGVVGAHTLLGVERTRAERDYPIEDSDGYRLFIHGRTEGSGLQFDVGYFVSKEADFDVSGIPAFRKYES